MLFLIYSPVLLLENDEDNLTTLKAIKESLSDYGFAVIDFMNVNNVAHTLVPEETKVVDGITFNLKRYLKTATSSKKSLLRTKARTIFFSKSKALTLQDFKT
jgi:hypothetical protein